MTVDNDSDASVSATITTEIYALDSSGNSTGSASASLDAVTLEIPAAGTATAEMAGRIINPNLWGPPPSQVPNLYEAVTFVSVAGSIIDEYTTRFGVRSFDYSPDQGLFVNGERIQVKGVNNHHDLGALGAIANSRGKERELEILADVHHGRLCRSVDRRLSRRCLGGEILEGSRG